MNIDIFTLFPGWFDWFREQRHVRNALTLGHALEAVDLRATTPLNAGQVDDTPYGGGAGMVMRPEPWGEALDALVPADTDGAVLVVPGPGGEPLSQRLAADLATARHLVFACGRYEGIDQRVLDDAASRIEVREVSLGDYVLNGGEVAALAIIEAVARLLPGFVGNAESLVEESHQDGLLEYPVYTKPATWRDREVPEVLLSGDHARIAAWRREQALRRTAERRPDLRHPAETLDGLEIRLVDPADAGELFTMQRACWVQEMQANPGAPIPALEETYADLQRWITTDTVLVVRSGGRLVGAVRASLHDGPEGAQWDIGRLMVAPDLQGRGIGRMLLERIEAAAPEQATGFVLFTGAGSTRNQKMYQRAGYRLRGEIEPGVVTLTKRR
jgi:tRNA (guanine37-N1)-methyltransferase